MLTPLGHLQQGNLEIYKKLMKIVDIDGEDFYIF